MLLYFIVGIVAYLLGSIPFGLILVRIFRKQDIRTQGSGNIGATNVIRSGGKGLGAVTFLLDAAKGFVAVCSRGRLRCTYTSRSYRRRTWRQQPRLRHSSGTSTRFGCDSKAARASPPASASFSASLPPQLWSRSPHSLWSLH